MIPGASAPSAKENKKLHPEAGSLMMNDEPPARVRRLPNRYIAQYEGLARTHASKGSQNGVGSGCDYKVLLAR